MKLPKIPKLPQWLTNLASLPNIIASSREYGPKPPRGGAGRALRLQWLGVCLAAALLINVAMFLSLRWTYPSDDEMHFREEVSTLLSIQGYLIAAKPNDIIPSMDSIRDVVFGPKITGAALRQHCKDMLRDRKKISLDPILANTVEESVKRWDQAEKAQHRQQKIFVLGFLTISLGVPTLLFLLGLPGYARAHAAISKRRSNKEMARSSARLAATTRIKNNLKRQREKAVHAQKKPHDSAQM